MSTPQSLSMLPDLGVGIRTLNTPESDRLREQIGVRHTVYPCVTCGDAGTFQWWDRYSLGGDPSKVVTYECPCIDQWILHRYLSAHGIGLAYQRLSGHDAIGISPDGQAVVMDWFTNRDAYIRSGVGLVLHGSGGTGKTLSSNLLLKKILSDGGDGFFLTFKDLLDLQSDGWRDKEHKDWFNRRIRSAGLLVIDDIGKENHSRKVTDKGLKESVTTGYAQSTLDSVLRSRVADALPTIVTTNIDFDDVTDAYSASIFDLLVERSVVHRFTGGSFRTKSMTRSVDEARSGLSRPVVVS